MEKNLDIKQRVVSLLDKFGGDKSISVEDLVSKFKKEISDSQISEREAEKSTIEDFTGVYLKMHVDENQALGKFTIFDKFVEVIRIFSLEASSYTEDYERTYSLSGDIMKFSKINVYRREFDSSVHSLFSEAKLRQFTVISEEEYNEFVGKYNMIDYVINKILE